MKSMKLILTLTSLLVAGQVMAAEYDVDASHSSVGFKVRHLISKTPGEFKTYTGKFSFDEHKPEASSVEFVIKADSINTNDQKRDDHLKSADFFDVTKHPEITFKSTKVAKAGKNKFKVTGDFNMHGVTKPVTFDVEYTGTAKDPWGNTKAGFSANTKINRKDWGIVWNKAMDNGGLVVGDDVEIALLIEATQKK